MPEFYAAFNKKTGRLSVREKTSMTTPFTENEHTSVMGPFEASGSWDAASKAREHLIKEIRECRQDQNNEKS